MPVSADRRVDSAREQVELPLAGARAIPEPASARTNSIRFSDRALTLAGFTAWLRSVFSPAVRRQIRLSGAIERRRSLWGGAAVLAGTRIPIFAIEDEYRNQGTVEAAASAFPNLGRADVHVALAYAEYDPEGIDADRANYLKAIPPGLRDR